LAIAFLKTVALRGEVAVKPFLTPAQSLGRCIIAVHFVHLVAFLIAKNYSAMD